MAARHAPAEHGDEQKVQYDIGKPRGHGNAQAKMGLFCCDEKALEHILQHEHRLARQQDSAVNDAVLQHGTEQMFVFRLGHSGGMGTQHREFQCLAGFGGQVPPGQADAAPGADPSGGAVVQRGLADIFAAQEIRRRPLCRLQHGQQKVAGIGSGASLLPGQRQSPPHRSRGGAGKTFMKIQHIPPLSAHRKRHARCVDNYNKYRRSGCK